MFFFSSEKKKKLTNISRSIEDNRKGRKSSDKLLKRSNSSAVACATTSVYENNEDFVLELSSKKHRCTHCKNDILFRTTNMVDRLCFRHMERYVFPRTFGPDGRSWQTTAITNVRQRPQFYHANPACIYGRFRREYFDNMPVVIEPNALPFIQFLASFSHPRFT